MIASCLRAFASIAGYCTASHLATASRFCSQARRIGFCGDSPHERRYLPIVTSDKPIRGTCPPLPAAPGSPASCSVPSARRDADLACRLSALWNRYGVPCSPTTRPPVESLLIEPTKDPRHLGEGWFRRAVGCATFRTRRTGTGRYARRWPGRTTSSTRVVAHGSHAVGRSRCAAVECRIVRGRGALEPAADRPFALRSRNAWRSWDSARQLRSGISWPECEAVDPSPDDVAPPNTLRNAVRSGMLNQ
jgi:hypothetical protein